MCSPSLLFLGFQAVGTIAKLSSDAKNRKQRAAVAREQKKQATSEKLKADLQLRDQRRTTARTSNRTGRSTEAVARLGGSFGGRSFFRTA